MIRQISINAKEWVDKTYGNSYFSATVKVESDEKNVTFEIPFTNGYDSAYEDNAFAVIRQLFNINTTKRLSWYARENNILLNTNIQKRCLKKELIPYNRKNNDYQFVPQFGTPFQVISEE